MSTANARGLQNLHAVDYGDVETLAGTFLVYFCIDCCFCPPVVLRKGLGLLEVQAQIFR